MRLRKKASARDSLVCRIGRGLAHGASAFWIAVRCPWRIIPGSPIRTQDRTPSVSPTGSSHDQARAGCLSKPEGATHTKMYRRKFTTPKSVDQRDPAWLKALAAIWRPAPPEKTATIASTTAATAGPWETEASVFTPAQISAISHCVNACRRGHGARPSPINPLSIRCLRRRVSRYPGRLNDRGEAVTSPPLSASLPRPQKHHRQEEHRCLAKPQRSNSENSHHNEPPPPEARETQDPFGITHAHSLPRVPIPQLPLRSLLDLGNRNPHPLIASPDHRASRTGVWPPDKLPIGQARRQHPSPA